MPVGIQRHILDCTLRDGGYVNNWEFDTEAARGIIDAVYESGIRNIELGIMGFGTEAGKSTKFSNFDEMEPLLNNRKEDCCYYVMMNQAEAARFDVPPKDEIRPDCVRLAFFKQEWQSAIAYAELLKEKGYRVFLQTMATFLYSDEELTELLTEVNRIEPDAFYIVDSFGVMYNEDVRKMAEQVCNILNTDILFGFHAHNNTQMAFSNTITFLQSNLERDLITDCSIYGMGRGAGNVPTELLMKFMNAKYGANYDYMPILSAYDEYLRPIFNRYFWGYSMEYFLTASKNINSAYGWYLGSKNIAKLCELNEVLEKIPTEIRYTLSKAAADAAIEFVHKKEKMKNDGKV